MKFSFSDFPQNLNYISRKKKNYNFPIRRCDGERNQKSSDTLLHIKFSVE